MSSADVWANIIAVLALLGSGYSLYRGERLSRKLRDADSKRATFDEWIAQTLEVHLRSIELSMTQMRRVSIDLRGDANSRAVALLEMQNGEFLDTVQELSALTVARADVLFKTVFSLASGLVDDVLDTVAHLSMDVSETQLREICHGITIRKQQFSSAARSAILAERTAIK